ncbi:predicted protein [Lichtheimia corymbifera JMRC:FSU:9682]|uniref:Uncharacterized protein n=1 Tax=Lichtheimia corymbifera JMRC:FSU:9682 TaxID=1263082 RepID=A0A068S9U1_9FUNG|nr:predicted protein [Lichtheimia corymbifera JMRC:FSU:9682]
MSVEMLHRSHVTKTKDLKMVKRQQLLKIRFQWRPIVKLTNGTSSVEEIVQTAVTTMKTRNYERNACTNMTDDQRRITKWSRSNAVDSCCKVCIECGVVVVAVALA